MPSSVELAAANDTLGALVQQQANVKEREEQEERDTAIGSLSFRVSGFG